MKDLIKIKGDASSREFFRKKNNGSSTIIVFSKKEKSKNLIIYDSINKILIKNKILAPVLYNENYSKNNIEIQDFGNETIFKLLSKKDSNKLNYFKKIIKLLNQIQQIKDTKVKNFKKRTYKVPKYSKKILIKEANLFCDWYIKKNLSKTNRKKFSKEFHKIIKDLTNKLRLKNNIFVHRDFHVSNLMLVKNQIGVIDSQDALIGNRAYDLASLIDDVRFKTSKELKQEIYNFYVKKQKKFKISGFRNDFEILSILRNLKIIGIFTRLAMRDGKKKYLKLIPYTWQLISMRINGNILFEDLKKLLKKSFRKKLNDN
tara:strand:- start:1381 stop:2328 length:948 start_codon:yes stop_codon:yes gene_type:complete